MERWVWITIAAGSVLIIAAILIAVGVGQASRRIDAELQGSSARAAPAMPALPLSATAIPVAGNDDLTATRFLELIVRENYAFSWHFETEPPRGFYEGSAPHGGVLRAYMNDIAFDAVTDSLGTFPAGSIIVKENHNPGDLEFDLSDGNRAVPGFDGNLEAITFMVKLDGYNPEAGDWFWAKFAADGSLEAAGRPAGCIACHTQVSDNDWVFDANVTSAPLARSQLGE